MALEDGSGCRNEFYQLNEAAPWANRSDDETDSNIGKQIGEDPIPLTVTRAGSLNGKLIGILFSFKVNLSVLLICFRYTFWCIIKC